MGAVCGSPPEPLPAPAPQLKPTCPRGKGLPAIAAGCGPRRTCRALPLGAALLLCCIPPLARSSILPLENQHGSVQACCFNGLLLVVQCGGTCRAVEGEGDTGRGLGGEACGQGGEQQSARGGESTAGRCCRARNALLLRAPHQQQQLPSRARTREGLREGEGPPARCLLALRQAEIVEGGHGGGGREAALRAAPVRQAHRCTVGTWGWGVGARAAGQEERRETTAGAAQRCAARQAHPPACLSKQKASGPGPTGSTRPPTTTTTTTTHTHHHHHPTAAPPHPPRAPHTTHAPTLQPPPSPGSSGSRPAASACTSAAGRAGATAPPPLPPGPAAPSSSSSSSSTCSSCSVSSSSMSAQHSTAQRSAAGGVSERARRRAGQEGLERGDVGWASGGGGEAGEGAWRTLCSAQPAARLSILPGPARRQVGGQAGGCPPAHPPASDQNAPVPGPELGALPPAPPPPPPPARLMASARCSSSSSFI